MVNTTGYLFVIMPIVLRFFPNGEFSQGVDTSQRRDKRRHTREHRHDPLTQECRDAYLDWVQSTPESDRHLCVPGQRFMSADGGMYTYLCEDSQGHHYAFESESYVLPDVLMNEPIGRMVARGELVPLVHQLVESSPQAPKPSRKRLSAMTKNMARNIRNAVFLLEEQYGKDQLSFLTLTLPNLSTDELRLCCESWDKMTDQLLKAMRKRLQKFALEFEYVYCTEIQSKRLQHRGEYAPHLHIVFRGRNGRKAGWCFTPKQIRKIWAGIIANVIGRSDFRTDALENLQRIKYSAARYLSKYLSKGSCSLPKDVSNQAISQLRTQWGGMARIQSAAVRRGTAYISGIHSYGGLGLLFLRHLDELFKNGIIKYYKEGFIPISLCPVTGVERVIKVCSGCLAIPTVKGGFMAVAEYLYGI